MGLGLIEKQIAKSRKLGDAEFARAMGPFSDAAAETIQGVQDDFDVFKGSFQQACKFLVCDPKKTEPKQLMGYIVGLLQAIVNTHATVKKKRKLKEKREKQEEAKRLKRQKREAQKKAMLDRMSQADRDKAEAKAKDHFGFSAEQMAGIGRAFKYFAQSNEEEGAAQGGAQMFGGSAAKRKRAEIFPEAEEDNDGEDSKKKLKAFLGELAKSANGK